MYDYAEECKKQHILTVVVIESLVSLNHLQVQRISKYKAYFQNMFEFNSKSLQIDPKSCKVLCADGVDSPAVRKVPVTCRTQ